MAQQYHRDPATIEIAWLVAAPASLMQHPLDAAKKLRSFEEGGGVCKQAVCTKRSLPGSSVAVSNDPG